MISMRMCFIQLKAVIFKHENIKKTSQNKYSFKPYKINADNRCPYF